MNRRRITINDVAKLAGVSYQTVSRVINNKPNVSPATRERVQQVIAETGYRPSQIARSLATARTATIGLVVPDIANPYFSTIARGVEEVAYAHNYSVLLCNTGEDVSRELEVLRTLDEMLVDGVIVCGLRQDDEPLQKAMSNFPAAVMVNRHLGENTIPAVLVDDERGGFLAVKHLLELGHHSIGFIAGPTTSYSGRRRLAGYKQAILEAGIEPRNEWVRNCIPTVTGGEAATHSLLSDHPEISALFCFNDLTAVGALRACDTLGLRIPEDLAVVGYDDIMLTTLVSPPLTSCRVPCMELGSSAVSMLLNCINNEADTCDEIVITPKLVIRASTVGTDREVLP